MTIPSASTPWPSQPDAKWPRHSLIENAAIHPREPWLAVACTNAEDETGAVLVFDAQSGSLRSSTPIDGFVGWSDRGLLRWHPDGVRLGTNVSTNGIALIDRAQYVGAAFPDETRDSGVGYVFIGDEILTETGALFAIQPDDWRFDFDELELPRLEDIEWNASARLVVGRLGTGVAAYDPFTKRVAYEATLAAFGERGTPDWSPDGRWCARRSFAIPPASDEILFVRGDTGQPHGLRRPSSPRIDQLAWAPEGSLAVSCYVHVIGPQRTHRHVDLFREGELRTTIDLGARAIQASHSLVDAGGMAWSPTADGIALLLDGQRVQVLDAHRGKALLTFDAPAPPIPAGLPDYYTQGHRPDFGFPGDLMWVHGQRLVRIAPHFVSIWSIDGTKVAEFVVPG